eukprot:scaffold106386_cov60-Phaeocystis_antarctica.AAC.2
MARAKGKKAVTEEASVDSEDDDVVITGTGFMGGGYLLPGAKKGVKFNKGGKAGAGKRKGEKAFAQSFGRGHWGDSEIECAFCHDEHCQDTPYPERPKFTVCPFVLLPDSYVRNEDKDPAPILAAERKNGALNVSITDKNLRAGDQVFKNVYSHECGACCTRWAWLATRGHRRPPG